MKSTKFNSLVSDLKTLSIKQVEGRNLKPGEILVKVLAAPVNPADRLMAKGLFRVPGLEEKVPYGVGFDGAGIVEDAYDEADQDLIGKTVSVMNYPHSPSYQGVFRQYLYLPVHEAIPFPEGTDPETVFMFVNPLTVMNFMGYMRRDKHKAIISGAAGSSIGKMLMRYCNKLEVPLINIVRREEQVNALKDLGAEHVLNSTSGSFLEDLKELAEKFEATGFFDPVGGDQAIKILEVLPPLSTLYLYDNLSEWEIKLNAFNMIFPEKSISTINVGPWMGRKSQEEMKEIIGEIAEDLTKGGEVFGASVYKTYPLSEFQQAFEDSVTHASEGKCLIKPNEE